jgi:hypothetical protein
MLCGAFEDLRVAGEPRRVGTPCPPSYLRNSKRWWAETAHPTSGAIETNHCIGFGHVGCNLIAPRTLRAKRNYSIKLGRYQFGCAECTASENSSSSKLRRVGRCCVVSGGGPAAFSFRSACETRPRSLPLPRTKNPYAPMRLRLRHEIQRVWPLHHRRRSRKGSLGDV